MLSSPTGLPILFILGIVALCAVAWHFVRDLTSPTDHEVGNAAPASKPDTAVDSQDSDGVVEEPAAILKHSAESLGLDVKNLCSLLAVPVKNELRKSRGATAYDDIFTTDFMELVWRFSAADGVVKPEEAKVYLDIHRALHPRTPLGIENIVRLLEGYPQRNPASLQQPIQASFLLRLVQDADRIAGTTYAHSLAAVMYTVAEQVALADGPLTAQEQDDLDALRAAFHLSPLDQRVTLGGQGQSQQTTTFCTACGQQLPPAFAYCIRCGAKVETPASPAAGTLAAIAQDATTIDRRVTEHWAIGRIGLIAGILIGALIISNIVIATFGTHGKSNSEQQATIEEQKKREAEVAFNSMTPARHLEKGKLALKPGSTPEAITEGLRHLEAIPSSTPEAAAAKTLRRKLTTAQNRLTRSREAVPQPKKERSATLLQLNSPARLAQAQQTSVPARPGPEGQNAGRTSLPTAKEDSCDPYRAKYSSLNIGDRWTKLSQVLGRPTKMKDTAGGDSIYEYEFGECRLVFRPGINNTLIAKQVYPSFSDSLR